MKTLIVALALFAGLLAEAAPTIKVYEAGVRITPGASPSYLLAFQNTSSSQEVEIHKIDVHNASTQTVTGGTMQFWLYLSTSLTHSAAVSNVYGFDVANASLASNISMSTAPVNVLIEGNSAILTALQRNDLGVGVPPFSILHVNNDEAAAANYTDEAWDSNGLGRPLRLAAGSNRAIVLEKRQLGSSDFTAGQILLRIIYSIK